MFKKKNITPVQIETTEQIVARAIDNLAADLCSLTALKDNALSVFRNTANKLSDINEKLEGKINIINGIIENCTSEKENAEKIVADNEAVRKKILEIIGE